MVVFSVSTSFSLRGGTPFSNRRLPPPSTTGAIQKRYSSTRPAAISACSTTLLPQTCNSGPFDFFSRRTAATTSPPRRCDFSQPRPLDRCVMTYFFARLNAAPIGLSPCTGQ